jgi:hypothetical protein
MSYTIVDIYTRPSTDIAFFSNWSDLQSYVNTTYILTGKLLSTEIAFSNDQDVQTITRTFVDQAAYDQWHTDPVMVAGIVGLRDYNQANGITHVLVLPN